MHFLIEQPGILGLVSVKNFSWVPIKAHLKSQVFDLTDLFLPFILDLVFLFSLLYFASLQSCSLNGAECDVGAVQQPCPAAVSFEQSVPALLHHPGPLTSPFGSFFLL